MGHGLRVDFLGQAAFMLLLVGPCVTTPSHFVFLQAIFRYYFPVSRDLLHFFDSSPPLPVPVLGQSHPQKSSSGRRARASEQEV